MADHSALSLNDLEDTEPSMACPSTPGGLSVDEFAEAKPLPTSYCTRVTVEEFEEQGTTETEKALNELISCLEKDPSILKGIMEKRKKEDSGKGIVSYLKSRLMGKLHGEQSSSVSDKECQDRVEELTNGMIMVYNYAQESQGRRFSKRLANKRLRQEMEQGLIRMECSPQKMLSHVDHNRPLMPQISSQRKSSVPLKDQTNTQANCSSPFFDVDLNNLKRKPIGVYRKSSLARESLRKVHNDILSGDPQLKLKESATPKSPGGTPAKRPRSLAGSLDNSLNWTNPFNSPEPLSHALFRILETKFRNIRSPSPGPHDSSFHSEDGEFSF